MLAARPQHNNNMLLCHNIILLVAFSRAGLHMLAAAYLRITWWYARTAGQGHELGPRAGARWSAPGSGGQCYAAARTRTASGGLFAHAPSPPKLPPIRMATRA